MDRALCDTSVFMTLTFLLPAEMTEATGRLLGVRELRKWLSCCGLCHTRVETDPQNPCKKQLGIAVLSGWFRRWGARDRRIPVAHWLASLAYKASSRPVRDSAKGTKRTEPEQWPLRLSSGLQWHSTLAEVHKERETLA